MSSANPAKRAAAYAMHAAHDPRVTSTNGRRAAWERFLRLVDPDGTLPEPERIRRAEALRHSHMLRIAVKSAKARAERKRAALVPVGSIDAGAAVGGRRATDDPR